MADDENLSAAAAEADAQDQAELEQVSEPETRDYIEYLGDPANVTGVSFLHAHTIPRGDPLWKRAGLKVTKDVTWERDPYGPGIGQPGNRFLVSVADLPDGTATILAKTPGFKRVTE